LTAVRKTKEWKEVKRLKRENVLNYKYETKEERRKIKAKRKRESLIEK
jgi:hypothetical protein